MNGTAILSRFIESGYSLALGEDGEIAASGPKPPSDHLRRLVEEDRAGLKAAILLSDPPKWLRLILDRYATGQVSEIKMTHPDGKARPTRMRITTRTLCANVAAAIGLSPLEGERVRPEVEACLDRHLAPDEELDTDDLVGKRFQAMVSIKKTSKGNRTEYGTIRPYRPMEAEEGFSERGWERREDGRRP